MLEDSAILVAVLLLALLGFASIFKLELSEALASVIPTLIKSKPTQVQKGKAPMGPSKKTSKLALNMKPISIQVMAN